MMIVTDKIDITITNQGKYWASLGYGTHKQGTVISVFVKDLPKNSNKKIDCRCDECDKIWKVTHQSIMKQKEKHRCFGCNRKYVGSIMDMTNTINATKKRVGPNHHNWNPNKSEFTAYAYKVRLITEETYRIHKHIINPDNLPRTLCGIKNGYQLDHKISIKWGYEHGLNPKIVGGLSNLQMLSWQENRQKW